MTFYLVLFVVPAMLALWQVWSPGQRTFKARVDQGLAGLAWLGVTLAVGLRHEVGGDWLHYARYITEVEPIPWGRVPHQLIEPAYTALSWIAGRSGASLHSVNVICAALFGAGLVVFCWQWPRPWLALAVAMPYLVVVVGMGYTRQSVGIGLLLLALVWSWRSTWAWRAGALAVVGLAALFHKTALAVAALAVALRFGVRHLRWVLLAALAVVLLLFVVAPHLGEKVFHLAYHYLHAEIYRSRGTVVRAALTAVAGLAFLLLRHRLALPAPQDRTLWLASWVALGLLGMALVMPASTAIDRVGLYLLPLQMAVWAVLPSAFEGRPVLQRALVVAVLAAYGTMLLAWLHLSPFARFWVPYRWALPW